MPQTSPPPAPPPRPAFPPARIPRSNPPTAPRPPRDSDSRIPPPAPPSSNSARPAPPRAASPPPPPPPPPHRSLRVKQRHRRPAFYGNLRRPQPRRPPAHDSNLSGKIHSGRPPALLSEPSLQQWARSADVVAMGRRPMRGATPWSGQFTGKSQAPGVPLQSPSRLPPPPRCSA